MGLRRLPRRPAASLPADARDTGACVVWVGTRGVGRSAARRPRRHRRLWAKRSGPGGGPFKMCLPSAGMRGGVRGGFSNMLATQRVRSCTRQQAGRTAAYFVSP